MKLEDLLGQYPEFRLLSQKDNSKITKFFNESSMQTSSLKLRYERYPNFFTFLNYQSDEVFVLGGDKDEKSIKAVATMTLRDGYVDGVKKRIAYLGDLRVKSGVKYSMRWQQLFGDILKHGQQMEDVKADIFLTAVMAGNEKAIKALIENTRSPYVYRKLCDYKMVNILTTYRSQGNLKNIDIKRATINDQKELLDFVEKKYKKKPFGFTRDFVLRALKSWDNFSIENFILLKERGEIVGCTATWNPSPAKKIVIESLPFKLKLLNYLVSIFTKTAKVNEELKIQYLNFLILSKKEDLAYFIEFLRQEKTFKKFDMVSFADFEPFNYRDVLKGVVMDLTPLELYQVELKKLENDKHKFCWFAPPAFEIALV